MDKDSSAKKEEVSDSKPPPKETWSSDEEDSDSDDSEEEEEEVEEGELGDAKTPETAAEALKRRRERKKKKQQEDEDKEEEDEIVEEEDLWNFPVDDENWKEEHLGEEWADFWGDTPTIGYDPEMVDLEDQDNFDKLRSEGKGPPQAPYYVPYRKFYPSIPDNHYDIQTPEDVVHELERMEEFLVWVSYVFEDGSCYEGTVWDDLAHGKGVYTTPLELCRYEGEWFQNTMQGHGVLEVDLPVSEPPPDSQEANKMKEEGAILKSDYMNSFDKEWLKMDIEDLTEQQDWEPEPFEDSPEWTEYYGEQPEKGHYKYSGQWKHSRMHGCGVYEINGRLIWGKFYFGELLPELEECTLEQSAFHASLAEVAAAKARMFINKPDGMVREIKGPYSDPQHPYMYEEEDLWMAPGFINAYYEVPEDWKLYVEDLDKEREMWLNSFIKSPLRIPMPPELEYWWSQDDEFVVLGNRPTAALDYNPENVAKCQEGLQGEVLLHVPTGRIINWATDKDGRLQFFLQPFNEDGAVKPEAVVPLPSGFDKYMEASDQTVQVAGKKQNFLEKFREKWKEFDKEKEQMRQLEEEELQRRLKQEDQMMEEQQKMKDAEAQLAEEIENEEFNARYREIYEKAFGSDDQEVSEEQGEEDSAETGNVEGEQQEEAIKVDSKKPPEGTEEVENEEDDGDDKKPRSFGKVAMVDTQGRWDKQDSVGQGSRDRPKESAPFFPTAFASLSLAPRMVVGEVLRSGLCQAVSGLLSKRQYMQQHRGTDMKQSVGSQAKSPSKVVNRDAGSVSFSLRRKDMRLRAASYSRSWQQARKDVYGSTCKKSTELFSVSGIAGRKRGKRRGSGRPDFAGKDSSCMQDHGSNGVWCKPEFGFLSMAVPVEI